MTDTYPPKVELSYGVSGVFSLLRKAARDPATVIPAELLSVPIMSGRRIWKWHSVSGPDELEYVLATNGANYPRSKVIHSVMGPAMRDSLFVADDQTHQWQRRSVLAMYSAKRCKDHIPLFKDLVAHEAAKLPAQKFLRFDAARFLENITLRASLQTACESYDPPDLPALRRAMDAFSDATLRVTPSDVFNLPIILAACLKKRGAGSLTALKQDLSAQINARAATTSANHDDLLQHLLGAKDPATGRVMSKQQMLGNLMMMVVAGHEPPATALSWAIYLLATHPEAQDRARAEVLERRASPDGEAPFVRAVIEEAMRLYPVVPILLRDARDADRVGGCPVTGGSFMIVPVYAMHRSPVHWHDPDRFNPERFLSENAPRRAFLPFSTGARGCIGKTFAMVEMQVVLSEFLTRFRFTATPGKAPVPRTAMSLRPKGGVWIEAERL
ncbi:cytochrome P450 [Gymnodinialimonas sp.]